MNYIKLINSFWEVAREREDFSAHVQSLYFSLLYYANRASWKPFTLYREDIIEHAKLSKTTYYSSRELLREAGLISFEEGAAKSIKCTFTMLLLSQELSQIKDNCYDNSEDNNYDKSEDTSYDHTVKPINLKTNKHISNVQREVENKDASEASAKKQKKEKSPPGSAGSPQSAKSKPISWIESIFADLNIMKRHFEGTEYEQADLEYYHLKIGDWAIRKAAKKVNWELAIINWLKRDFKDGNLITVRDKITLKPQQHYDSEFEKRTEVAQKVLAGIDYDEYGNRR